MYLIALLSGSTGSELKDSGTHKRWSFIRYISTCCVSCFVGWRCKFLPWLAVPDCVWDSESAGCWMSASLLYRVYLIPEVRKAKGYVMCVRRANADLMIIHFNLGFSDTNDHQEIMKLNAESLMSALLNLTFGQVIRAPCTGIIWLSCFWSLWEHFKDCLVK